MLEERLLATEGTVRHTSKRLRQYRTLLHAAKRENSFRMSRSESETCLALSANPLLISQSCDDLHGAIQSAGKSGIESC